MNCKDHRIREGAVELGDLDVHGFPFVNFKGEECVRIVRCVDSCLVFLI